jgi:indole-3-glycerol phosphate synthase
MSAGTGSPDLLGAVVAAARRSAEARAERTPLAALERLAAGAAPRGAAFEAALARPGRLNIVAECKRRSPSRGVLRGDYDPAAIARAYAAAGAAAISVLTEPAFFDGALDHLAAVRSAVSLPLLRKDFIVTEYQVVEARATGADAVLLIAATLDRPALARLRELAEHLGLAALVEVHDEVELDIALEAGARIVGVNNRNLRTLAVSIEASERLIERIPDACVAVAESGLGCGGDLRRLAAAGYDAFLIGEHLMTAPDPGAALAALLAEAGEGPR